MERYTGTSTSTGTGAYRVRRGTGGWGWRVRCALVALLCMAFAPMLPGSVVRAAQTFTVTTLADSATDANCTMASCSLRQAINASNATSGTDTNTIIFGTGVTGTITLTAANGLMTLDHNVTITGPTGTPGITVDGGCIGCGTGGTGGTGGIRILLVNSNITATLANLTIANGHAVFADDYGAGGGIINNGRLTVTNCTFANNQAYSRGGAITNPIGTLTVIGSTFTGNSADVAGAIFNGGGPLNVTGSTFTGNSSNQYGGAITNGGQTASVTNSTFSGNTTNGNGGAIETLQGAGAAIVTASTFTGNHAGALGGGIHNDISTALTLTQSIVAGNTDVNGAPDISEESGATFTDGGNNVVGIGAGGTAITNGTHGDKVGTAAAPLNALLSALGSYGGTTQTLAPLPGSPAIDIGACATGVTLDQRGVSRPQGASCDAGAVESRGFTLTTTGGNGQSAVINTAFATPLALTVAPVATGEPVVSGTVTFTITDNVPGGV